MDSGKKNCTPFRQKKGKMMPTTICIYYNEPGGLEPKPDAIFCFSFGPIGNFDLSFVRV